jgi:hypothetical protein
MIHTCVLELIETLIEHITRDNAQHFVVENYVKHKLYWITILKLDDILNVKTYQKAIDYKILHHDLRLLINFICW